MTATALPVVPAILRVEVQTLGLIVEAVPRVLLAAVPEADN